MIKVTKPMIKVTFTPSKTQQERADFLSLRAALEWAKDNNITDLHLIKIIAKKPLDK